jgi:hypothetical protein
MTMTMTMTMTITITHPTCCDQDGSKYISGSYTHAHAIAVIEDAWGALRATPRRLSVILLRDETSVGELTIQVYPTDLELNSEKTRRLANALLQAADQFDEITG